MSTAEERLPAADRSLTTLEVRGPAKSPSCSKGQRMAAKRIHPPDDALEPPLKLARRVEKLRLSDAGEEAPITTGLSPTSPDDSMQGVEAPDFVHVSPQDWLDAINEIEIDDRFTKIPRNITSPSEKYFERPSTELIPYEPAQRKERKPPQTIISAGQSDIDMD